MVARPKNGGVWPVSHITAVPELLYPGTIDIEWHFPQENATFHDSNKATDTLDPL
jgi:hypothetical protein